MATNEQNERERLGVAALDAWVEGRVFDVQRLARQLGPEYLRLDVAPRSGWVTLCYHPDGDAVEPEQGARPTTVVRMQLAAAGRLLGIDTQDALLLRLREIAESIRQGAKSYAGLTDAHIKAGDSAFAREVLRRLCNASAELGYVELHGCGGMSWETKGEGYSTATRLMRELCTAGLVRKAGKGSSGRGFFRVTDAGRDLHRMHSEHNPKSSRTV